MTEETDTLVTQTYRDGAQERTPEHLTHEILKSAADAARSRYSRLSTWTRPMAWAATVMLSVALVLEVSKAPTPEAVTFDGITSKFETSASDRDQLIDAPADDEAAESLEEEAFPATSPGRASNVAAEATLQSEAEKEGGKQVPIDPGPEKRQRDDAPLNSMAERQLATPAASSDEFQPKDAQLLQRAEDLARNQNGSIQELDQAAPAAKAVGASFRRDAGASCSDELTAAPSTWLDCIEELENAGLTDAANEQREQLRAIFPDFEIP